MQKFIMTLLMVAAAGLACTAPDANAKGRDGNHGGPGHGREHGDRTDLIDRIATHKRERVILIHGRRDCELRTIRLYDDEGNIYLKRARFCDRRPQIEF